MMESANPKGTNGVASEPGQNLETSVGYYDSIPIYATQHMATAITDHLAELEWVQSYC